MRTTPLDFVAKAVFKIKYMHLISTAIQRGNARCIINIPIGRSWDKKRKHKTKVSESLSVQNNRTSAVLGVSGCGAAGGDSSPAKTVSNSLSVAPGRKAKAENCCGKVSAPTCSGQTRRGSPRVTGLRRKGSETSAIPGRKRNRSFSELRVASRAGGGLASGGKSSVGGVARKGS